MSTIDDGGDAFPRTDGQSGMSLRDWFAGQALAGMCAGMNEKLVQDIGNGIRGGKYYVFAAFILADAMIIARKAEDQP